MKDETKLPSSAANKRQVRLIIYINDVEMRSEWLDYNPVTLTNQMQACVQSGHCLLYTSDAADE